MSSSNFGDKAKEYAMHGVIAGVAGAAIGFAASYTGGIALPPAVPLAAAAGAGAVVSSAAHDYILPYLPQDEKYVQSESAALGMASTAAGAYLYMYLMYGGFGNPIVLGIAAVAADMTGNYAWTNYIKPMTDKSA